MELEDRDAAEKAYRANLSPRFIKLDSLDSWVEGRQYAGLKSWWDDCVPLWERAPCFVYPVAKIAIMSNVDLVLGEGRFPAFSSSPGEGEEDEEDGLGEEDSAKLDRFINKHHTICRFRAHCREAFTAAQSCGTAVAVHGVRAGKPHADLIPAKWCVPKLGYSGEVLLLEIRYPYIEQYKKPNGAWGLRTRLYRRVITDTNDITYYPAEAREDGVEPRWVADPAQSVTHGLGFSPVIWYPFDKGCVPVNEIDGHSIHGAFRDEIRGHDIAISQRHRGALFSEPQMCEIGVNPGYNPTDDTGRTAVIPSVDADGNVSGWYLANEPTGPSSAARKKGPGYVNQYGDPETKVQYLTYPGDALKAQDENATDLRRKLQEMLCVVFLDPDNIRFAATTSGKALEAIKQKQIDRCSIFRDDLRDNFLLPSLDMQLRIASKVGKGLRVPGIDDAIKLLSKFDAAEAA